MSTKNNVISERVFSERINDYSRHLDMKHFNDNRSFWKKIKPFLSDREMNSNKMMTIEKDKLVPEETPVVKVVEVMSNYFVNIWQGLNLKDSPELNKDNNVVRLYLLFKSYI